MPRHFKHARPGDLLVNIYTADWYNYVNAELARLENLVAKAPLRIENAPGGSVISLGKTIQSIVFCKLAGALIKNGSVQATVYRGDPLSSALIEDTNFKIQVYETCGIAAKKNALGNAYTHKNDPLERWVWLPCALT